MITTLALDLEGTLISNAMSQIPRPGLYDFLVRCRAMVDRLVIYTAIAEPRCRAIAAVLVADKLAPAWFADIEYVTWSGTTKDLACVPGVTPREALLLDDLPEYVHPGQEAQWVPIAPFVAPYPADDTALAEVMGSLESRCLAPDSSIITSPNAHTAP